MILIAIIAKLHTRCTINKLKLKRKYIRDILVIRQVLGYSGSFLVDLCIFCYRSINFILLLLYRDYYSIWHVFKIIGTFSNN